MSSAMATTRDGVAMAGSGRARLHLYVGRGDPDCVEQLKQFELLGRSHIAHTCAEIIICPPIDAREIQFDGIVVRESELVQ